MKVVVEQNGVKNVVFESNDIIKVFNIQAEWVKRARKDKTITYVGYEE